MRKPKNGMQVLFSPPKCSCGIVDMGQPLAAIITHVWKDDLVTLTVFDAEGSPWSQRNVKLVEEDEKPTHEAYCYFPQSTLDDLAAAAIEGESEEDVITV